MALDGWYYMHKNGDLIYKRDTAGMAADIRESDFANLSGHQFMVAWVNAVFVQFVVKMNPVIVQVCDCCYSPDYLPMRMVIVGVS